MDSSDKSTSPVRWILQPLVCPRRDYSNLKRLYFFSNTQIESDPRLWKLRRLVLKDPRLRKLEANETIQVRKQPQMQHLKKKLTEWKETEGLTKLMIEADQLKKLDVTKKRKEDQEKEEDHIEVIYEKLCDTPNKWVCSDQRKKVKGCYKVFDIQRQYSEHIEARRMHGNICPERIECITIG